MAPLRGAVFKMPCYADFTLTVCTNCSCTHNVTTLKICCNKLGEKTESVEHEPPSYSEYHENQFEGCFWEFGLVGLVTLLFAALVMYTVCSLPPRPRLVKSFSMLRPKINSVLKSDNNQAVMEEHRQVTISNVDITHGIQSILESAEPVSVKMMTSSDAMLSNIHSPMVVQKKL